MASDDDPESPRGAGGWDGVERRGQIQLPREAWKIDPIDERKLVALLACIKFSGVDLLDIDDQIAFTERLARAKRKYDWNRKWRELRMGSMLTVAGGVLVWLISQGLPMGYAWIKGRM